MLFDVKEHRVLDVAVAEGSVNQFGADKAGVVQVRVVKGRLVGLNSAKVVVDHVASRKKDMGENAAAKRAELHVAFQHSAVRKNRMVKETHS